MKILKKGEQLFKRVFPNTYFYKISINLKNKKIVLILYLNKNLQFDFFYSSFFLKLKYYFVSLWTPLTIQMKSTNWRIINIHRISPDWNALMSHLSLVLWNMNGQDLFFFFSLILWSKHTQDDKLLQLPTENTGGAANGTTASRAGATSNPNP